MIALDTNLLVYAHRQDSPWHERAHQALVALSQAKQAWAIPWPCLHEFLAIVTHPRIYDPPTPLGRALDQVEAWLESPSLVLLAETDSYWQQLREALSKGRIRGAQVHVGRVVYRSGTIRQCAKGRRAGPCGTPQVLEHDSFAR
jgi:predicted nucleic acid-binding protein